MPRAASRASSRSIATFAASSTMPDRSLSIARKGCGSLHTPRVGSTEATASRRRPIASVVPSRERRARDDENHAGARREGAARGTRVSARRVQPRGAREPRRVPARAAKSPQERSRRAARGRGAPSRFGQLQRPGLVFDFRICARGRACGRPRTSFDDARTIDARLGNSSPERYDFEKTGHPRGPHATRAFARLGESALAAAAVVVTGSTRARAGVFRGAISTASRLEPRVPSFRARNPLRARHLGVVGPAARLAAPWRPRHPSPRLRPRPALARVPRARALPEAPRGSPPRPRVLARVRAAASGQQPFWDNAPTSLPTTRPPRPELRQFYSPPRDGATWGRE